jgi:hypothetical protein
MKKTAGLAVLVGAVGAGVFLECFLRQAVKSECSHGAVKPRHGQTPGAVGAAPAGEVVPFDPDQAFTHTSPAFCVRLGLERGRGGRNTSTERAWKVNSCLSPQNIFHEIEDGQSD